MITIVIHVITLQAAQSRSHDTRAVVLSVVPRLAASASPENFLEIRVLRPYYRPPASETRGLGLHKLYFSNPPGDSDAC